MKKASISLTLFLFLFLLTSSKVYAVEDPTPSTNDENKLKGGGACKSDRCWCTNNDFRICTT